MQVLSGMGGVGKTSLARAYAQRHLDDYDIMWWVRSEDPAAVDAEYRALLEILLPPGEALKIADARTVAFAQLAKQEQAWLLVVDNAPDTSVVLPPAGNGHILITSRATGWPDPTTVLPLGEEAAVELLTGRSGDTDRESATTLATELGGLPLALTQAAGFVRTSAINLAEYLRLYRRRSAELLMEGRPADYPHTVATTWQLAIERLSASARELLNVLAFYAPDAIPVHLLFADMDDLDRHRAIGKLCAYSLITPAESGSVSMHRLVQAVTRDPRWADKAHKLIIAAIPRMQHVTADGLATWNSLRTHVHALLDHVPPEHSLTTRLRVGYWTGEAGDAVGAREQFTELVRLFERSTSGDHSGRLSARMELARWTGHAGNTARARELLTELLPTCERMLGADDGRTLTVRHELGHWTGKTGDAAAARDHFADLLRIQEHVMGAEHPDALAALHELAHWTGQAGDAAMARDLFAKLLPILERELGANGPTTLFARNNLAQWIGEAGDAVRARNMFAELRPIRERVLGAEHPNTLTTWHCLAHWTGQAGDVVRARDLFARLLPVREGVLGVDHPDTARTRRGLEYWAKLAREAEEAGPGGGGEG